MKNTEPTPNQKPATEGEQQTKHESSEKGFRWNVGGGWGVDRWHSDKKVNS